MLKAIFPRLEVERDDGAGVKLSGGATVRRRWTFTGVPAEQTYPDGGGAVLRGKFGQGEVVITCFAHLDGPDAIATLVQQAVARSDLPLTLLPGEGRVLRLTPRGMLQARAIRSWLPGRESLNQLPVRDARSSVPRHAFPR